MNILFIPRLQRRRQTVVIFFTQFNWYMRKTSVALCVPGPFVHSFTRNIQRAILLVFVLEKLASRVLSK